MRPDHSNFPPPAGGVIEAVAWLDRVTQKASDSEDADMNRLADSLRLWRAGAPMEPALGLSGGWRGYLDQRTQHAALAALAAAIPQASCRALAEEIATRLTRYQAAGWVRDRDTGRRPDGLSGPLYDYLTADGPTSAERVRKMLGGLQKRV